MSTPANSWRSSAERRLIPTVEISPSAAIEIDDIRDWWLENREKAPNAFDEELVQLIRDLENRPALMGLATDTPNVRRAYLKRTRYYVYFRLADAGRCVQLLALWHSSRRGQPELR